MSAWAFAPTTTMPSKTAVFSECRRSRTAGTRSRFRQSRSLQHARDHHHCLDRPPRGLAHARADRSAELVAHRRFAVFQCARGRIHRIPVTGGEPEVIDTGFATRCNNDHGLSPDGNAARHQRPIAGPDRRSRIYILPVDGRHAAPSRRTGRPTGTAGRRTARRSPIAPSATANSTSTRSRSKAARKSDSPPPKASTTDRIIRPTENSSTSTPTAPARCTSGG